jgi:serine phosphatase RsbU (regulator of sigma subunit)
VEAGDSFILTSDGLIDQNGGDRDYPFGRKRLIEILSGLQGHALSAQRDSLTQVLQQYMGEEPQRDDITVLGFAFAPGGGRHDQDHE